jgi:hypothetical protein
MDGQPSKEIELAQTLFILLCLWFPMKGEMSISTKEVRSDDLYMK